MTIQNMMFNGVSGINSMANYMAVLSDNVANVNSVAYKASRVTFQDAITSALGTRGEVGNGSRLGAVSKPFTVGQFEASSRATDMAIAGRGFFMLRDPLQASAELYSRDGQFRLTGLTGAAGETTLNLVNGQGYFVQGYNFDAIGTAGTAIEDIVIRRESLPKATESVLVAANLQNDSSRLEVSDIPLYGAWDGGNAAGPIAEEDFDYRTIIAAYDDGGTQFDLTIYFDHTTNQSEQEFLVTCDPALDRRLIGATTTRYNDGPVAEKGAGALLYGKLLFNASGELTSMDCWDVPPDGVVNPTDATKITLARGEADYSFFYNISGSGANLAATLNFGTDPSAQSIVSPGSALASARSDAPFVGGLTSWDSVYDLSGNKVQDGDVITFIGTDGDGNPASLSYTVDLTAQLADLLTQLGTQFNCAATIVDGQLRLTDLVAGQSQLDISSISYLDAAGNSPLNNTSLAQCFGAAGAAFSVNPFDRYNLAAISTTNYATSSVTFFQRQDGFGIGYLQDLALDKQGILTGIYSNGQRAGQAQLALADFANFEGMALLSGNLFAATAAAGVQTIGLAGEGPLGNVQGHTLEMSNVDLGRQFADLVMTQRGFQVNSVSISTANEIYQTALRLK